MKLMKLIHPEQDEFVLKSKKVSLVAFLDTARKRKDHTSSIKLRIVHLRFPKYYSTGFNLTEEDYMKMCKPRPNPELRTIKKLVFQQLKKAYDIIASIDEFSFQAFESKFKTKRITNDLISYFEDYIEELNKEKRYGTADNYSCSKNKLLQIKNGCKSKIKFEEITVQFLKQFESIMLEEGCSPSTVGIYCRPIKKLYNDAIRNGDARLENYPFGNPKEGLYKPPQPRNIKKALSVQELKKLINYEPTPGSPEQRYLDFWLFSYLGNGINIKDICLLQFKHIQGDSIHFIRAKTANTNRTAKPIVITLIDQNRAIINRWGNKYINPNTFVFPILDGTETSKKQREKIKSFTKLLNKSMKKTVLKAGITTHVTTYTARHSFATVLKRSGTNIAYISEAMGHSNIKTTESYLDSFESEARQENTLKLIDL
ncbi:tyrosine-type recombinase/integrase [Maribellus maritimus]|uniref:tyrosine-type recombinase/integrase n=1 Tax=Maribellus maritimus TaxID=2870838 RepID=UPI001EEB04CA|nr:site-specific integrase [Maribellus maritimus]MCG6191377.1 site-specific integrase [Maribellus maritimus]